MDLISAIAEFEQGQSELEHCLYPEMVLNGRESIYTAFIITMDDQFKLDNHLPTEFCYSDTAMAAIINVVLDLPVDKLATEDTVRNVRRKADELRSQMPNWTS